MLGTAVARVKATSVEQGAPRTAGVQLALAFGENMNAKITKDDDEGRRHAAEGANGLHLTPERRLQLRVVAPRQLCGRRLVAGGRSGGIFRRQRCRDDTAVTAAAVVV